MSMQPNSGAQGEYAGLLTIAAYHRANGEAHRNICLIPVSAHGTNPASARRWRDGRWWWSNRPRTAISISTISAPRRQPRAAIWPACMITYPSTHGVFEETVRDVCQITHDHGGQVYLDGANLNAMVGLAKPGEIGGDVSHSEPAQDLLHPAWRRRAGHGADRGEGASGAASAGASGNRRQRGAGFGGTLSALPSILPISWAYILLMGGHGLTQATKVAILNANYIAKRLEGAYDILFTGKHGPCGA